MFPLKQEIITNKKSSKSVQKSIQKQQTTLGVFQSFKGMMTNFSYELHKIQLPYFLKQTHYKNKEEIKIHLLGDKLHSFEELMKKHQEIIWFTYRKHINISYSIHSDVGWGCLIRVAQMAMAEALRKYFHLNCKLSETNYIITPFLEEDGADIKYSINNFLVLGGRMWKMQPGQWYSMTQITSILESLHYQNSLKGSQNLKLKVYNEVINVSQLLAIFKAPTCKCQIIKITCGKCQTYNDKKQTSFSKKLSKHDQHRVHFNDNSKKNIFLMVTTKLGSKRYRQNNEKCLLELMQLSVFSGCLGGIPKQARFLTGKYGDEISYLDPHFVEESIDRMNLNKKMNTFHCKQLRLMKKQQLDQDITLCFYLKNTADLQMLIDKINQLSQRGSKLVQCEWQKEGMQNLRSEQGHKQINMEQKFESLQDQLNNMKLNNSMESSFFMQ